MRVGRASQNLSREKATVAHRGHPCPSWLKRFTCWPQKRLLVAMSYCPSGPPESQHRDIWVSGKVGDSRSRCIATSLHQKGYDASWQRKKNRKLRRSSDACSEIWFRLPIVTTIEIYRNIITCNSFYLMI